MPPDPATAPLTQAVMSVPMLFLFRSVLVLVLLMLAGFFSGSETALFSLSMAQRNALAQHSQEGDAVARRILWLLSNPRRLITTIILGNEVVNISFSALVTGLVTDLVEILPAHVSRPLSGEAVKAVIATVLAVPLLIVLGEFIPKNIGIKTALRWSRVVSAPVVLLTWLFALPRFVINTVAGAVLFVLGVRPARKPESAPVLREEEFRTLVDLGSAEGEIAGAERRMIHNVFEFGDLSVGRIMTTADRVFALSIEMPLSRMIEAVSRQRYSRVPIYKGKRDNVVGILFAKDLVGYARGGIKGRPLQEMLHPPLFVPRRAKCDRLLREFQRRKTHMALVVDEYGKLAGLITMEDLLLSLFGDLADSRTPTRTSSAPADAGEPPQGKA